MSTPQSPDGPGSERTTALPVRYDQLAPRAPEDGLDLFELFPEGAEIEMEIGFGRGMFLIERAAAAPNSYLLGIEIKNKWAYKVAQRCKRLGLDRVRPMAGDARLALPGLKPDASLARVFLHFPDPWWKKRHAKRRLMGEELLDRFARLLRDGGELYVQTDVQERADAYAEQLAAHPDFVLGGQDGYLDHNPYGARSNREKRADEDGLPVFRVLAIRRPRL
jgi:tRNA (guanine-N7-)-methyltransferase